MAKIDLPFVTKNVSKGKTYWRVRKGSFNRTLKGQPDSPEFMKSYQEAMDELNKPREVGKERTSFGSVSWAIIKYYKSPEFDALAKSTKTTYIGILDRFREKHGTKSIAGLTAAHIRKIQDTMLDKKAAANNLLKVLRQVCQYLVERDLLKSNPTNGVKPLRYDEKHHEPWTAEEMALFENKYPLGSRARLIFELARHTGQRRGDVVRFGWQHIKNGYWDFVQEKTKQRVRFKVFPELEAILSETPKTNMTFIVTEAGAPFSKAGFGNEFGDLVRKAGIVGKSIHGLRANMAIRLAEHGLSDFHIMSITGHQSLKEVQRYTRGVNRQKLADVAYSVLYPEKMAEQNKHIECPTLNQLDNRTT